MFNRISWHQALFLVCILSACTQPDVPSDFQVEPGFQLTRVAAEPLIKDPVDLEFNERGDALVLEMPGYPFEDKQSRIVVLKDRDLDGVYDDRVVFVENLQLATSFIPYKKGVLVAAPPYLLFVNDDDQNYVPEKVDTLMGGFATGNLQHNYNGLLIGLDNWIYAANGGNDGSPFWWNDTTSRMDLRGQDFRFNLETRSIERLGESSGGFGLAMDEYGRVFETHNLTHISHLVFPDRYLRGNPILPGHSLANISDHDENGLARIYPVGEQESRVNHPEQSGYFSGSCGVTYYGGGVFGEAYQGTVWVADVVLNLVHVDKITPTGASFRASRQLAKRDFLASSDRAFRPVNMEVGPDGALYVVDMYRKVIEHPEWIPDEIEKTLDLNAGKDQGRIYRIAKTDARNNFDVTQFTTTEGLLNGLQHPNQWVRMTAHRLLLDQRWEEAMAERVRGLLVSKNELTKLHALWLLHLKGFARAGDLANTLRDPSAPIRESALVISESWFSSTPSLVERGVTLINDPDHRVRMQAALSISTLSNEQFRANHAMITEAIRLAAVDPGDTWNIAALTLAAKDAVAEILTDLLANSVDKFSPELLGSFARASGSRGDIENLFKAIASSRLTESGKQLVIRQMTSGLHPGGAKVSESSIRSLEKSGAAGLIAELALLRSKLALPPSPEFLKMSHEAIKKVQDKSLPDSVRLQQLALIELLPYAEKSSVLFDCLHNTVPLKIQEMALRQLSAYPEAEIGQKVVEMWSELSPQTRRNASDMLLYVEIHHDALLDGLETGRINIGEMNFDLERRRQLLWWNDNENTKRRAEKLFSDSGVVNRQEAIDKMKPALALQGSAANGQRVFETTCASCHVYRTRGNEVGPALTEIARKSKETLMHDILDPNAAADPKYINHRLETRSGVVHMGIVAAETDQQVTIKKMGGENVVIKKDEIKSFRSLGTSLMMEGLESGMTHQELADLLAFLQNGSD